jgi:hypothetical protein
VAAVYLSYLLSFVFQWVDLTATCLLCRLKAAEYEMTHSGGAGEAMDQAVFLDLEEYIIAPGLYTLLEPLVKQDYIRT